jgi:hypothetical protein
VAGLKMMAVSFTADKDAVVVVFTDSVEVLDMADLARDKLAERIVRFFCKNHQFCRSIVLIYG